jgi:outer membrane protein assembly factor BamB
MFIICEQGKWNAEGKLAFLKANPKKHVELGRFQAIKGKTWNRPVIAHGRVYVRNAERGTDYVVGGSR